MAAGRGLSLRGPLRVFGRVHRGEALVATLLLLCLFLILCSYYMMKTAREGMILATGQFGLSGQELKAFASGAMALLLVGVMPLYSALATRVTRIKLINISYVTVLACLILFFTLSKLGVSIALAFFVWIGLVNVFLVAQFWSYANDLYDEEQGRRLFALIAIGGSLGAVLGPKFASLATTHGLLLFACVLIIPCLALFNIIDRLHLSSPHTPQSAREPILGASGFALLRADRYLMLIACLVFVAALVKTTGEYVLSDAAANHAAALVPDSAHADLAGAARHAAITDERREIIKTFYSSFFFWVNLTSFALQLFVVWRVLDRFGVRSALFVMPIVALGAYGAIAAIGGIALVRVAKIAENGTDYSLENTVLQTLFLPTARAAKYKAKAAIDTVAVRSGDTLSAILIWVALHGIGMHGRGLAVVNIALVAVWLALAVRIVRRHRQLSRAGPSMITGPTEVVAP